MNGGKPLTGDDIVRIAEEHGIDLRPVRDPLALPPLSSVEVSQIDRLSTVTFKVRFGYQAWTTQMAAVRVSLDGYSRSLARTHGMFGLPWRSIAKRQRDACRGRSPHRRRRHGRA